MWVTELMPSALLAAKKQRYMYKRHLGSSDGGPWLYAQVNQRPHEAADTGQRAATWLRLAARIAPGTEDHGEMRSRFDEERCSELVVLAKGKSWRG